MRQVLALMISVAALSATAGTMAERYIWEAKTMGDFCEDGRQWACYLHPLCEMNALICYDADHGQLQRGLDRNSASSKEPE